MRKPEAKKNGGLTTTVGVEPPAHSLKASKPRHPTRPYFLELFQAICQRCGYHWTPVITYDHDNKKWVQGYPKKCPACYSLHWDKPKNRREWDKRFKRNFDDGG